MDSAIRAIVLRKEFGSSRGLTAARWGIDRRDLRAG